MHPDPVLLDIVISMSSFYTELYTYHYSTSKHVLYIIPFKMIVCIERSLFYPMQRKKFENNDESTYYLVQLY